MTDYAEQTRVARNQTDNAKESQKRHASDLREMRDVADRAAEDLETRKIVQSRRLHQGST